MAVKLPQILQKHYDKISGMVVHVRADKRDL